MKYRDSIQYQLDKLEAKLKHLEFCVKRGETVETFIQTLNEAKENLAEAREPASQGERGGLM